MLWRPHEGTPFLEHLQTRMRKKNVTDDHARDEAVRWSQKNSEEPESGRHDSDDVAVEKVMGRLRAGSLVKRTSYRINTQGDRQQNSF
jgi:hypothetical protein